MGSKEALCASCVLLHVCSLKELFLDAQTAINDCAIYDEAINDGKIVTKRTCIRDIDFIKPVQLQCKHYMKGNEGVIK